MLQQEFEERTNCYLTQELFDEVHEQYMESGMDKDQFCNWWKANCQLAVTKQMAIAIYNRDGKIEEYAKHYSHMADLRNTAEAKLHEARQRVRELEAELAQLKQQVNYYEAFEAFNSGAYVTPSIG